MPGHVLIDILAKKNQACINCVLISRSVIRVVSGCIFNCQPTMYWPQMFNQIPMVFIVWFWCRFVIPLSQVRGGLSAQKYVSHCYKLYVPTPTRNQESSRCCLSVTFYIIYLFDWLKLHWNITTFYLGTFYRLHYGVDIWLVLNSKVLRESVDVRNVNVLVSVGLIEKLYLLFYKRMFYNGTTRVKFVC